MAFNKTNVFFTFMVFSSLFLNASCQGVWLDKQHMPTKRSDLTAVTIGQQIIVSGGCNETQICPIDSPVCFCTSVTYITEAYQPLTDNWITLPNMPIPRYRHAAAVVGNSMYLIGGRDINDTIIQTIDIYDSVGQTWSTLKSLWSAATSDLVAASIGTNVYAISGYHPDYSTSGDVWILDTITQSWSQGTVSSMNNPRGDACAVEINAKIYVFGGFYDNFCSPLNSLEVYDPATNIWSTKSPLHKPRGDAGCGVQHNEFHAIGGEQKNNLTGCTKYDVPIADVEHYDTNTDSWTEETSLPSVRFRFASAAFGNTFYIIGGQAGLNVTQLSYPVIDTVEAWEDTLQESSAIIRSVGFFCRFFWR